MEAKKRLVIIAAEKELSSLMTEFLAQNNLQYTIIANTTSDYILPSSTKEESDQIWCRHEIVKLAKAIIADDQLKGPFFKPLPKNKLDLPKEEQFLISWISSLHSTNQHISKFFKTITENFGKNYKVSSFNFLKQSIDIKVDKNIIPLRYFQVTGFIDFDSEEKADLDELQRLLDKSGEKKKSKLVCVKNLERNMDIIDDEVKKDIEQADAILFMVSDPCTFAILSQYEEFYKTIKDSTAPVTLVFPSNQQKGFSFRDQFILSLLDTKTTYLGLLEKHAELIDQLVVDPEDALEVDNLRSIGFNVIVEDLSKGKKSMTTILKGMGLSLDDIKIDTKVVDEKPESLEDLVTKLAYTPSFNNDGNAELEVEKIEPGEQKEAEEKDNSVEEASDVVKEKKPVITAKKSAVSELPDQDSFDKALAEIPVETGQVYNQETFTKAIQTFLTSQVLDPDLATTISAAIAQNSEMAIYAAKKLASSLNSYDKIPQLFQAFIEFTDQKPIIFIKELTDWILKDLDNLDYLAFDEKASIIIEMSKINQLFVEKFVYQLVDVHINKSLVPKKRERLRTLIGTITMRNITLQRVAINAYLGMYTKELSDTTKAEIWLGLIKFDAVLVVSELIERNTEIGETMLEDALARNLGSFTHILYEVFQAFKEGDLQRVLTITGTLSDTLLMKKQRVELASQIKKFGSVPMNTLAKRVEMDPKELENIVYEMIGNGEVNAQIEVIDGRLVIIHEKRNGNNEANGK